MKKQTTMRGYVMAFVSVAACVGAWSALMNSADAAIPRAFNRHVERAEHGVKLHADVFWIFHRQHYGLEP